MDNIAPIAIAPPHQSQDQWHRRSLLHPNSVQVQPASPEVISSLISSLSANFDDSSSTVSPTFLRSSKIISNTQDIYEAGEKTVIGTSFGMDYSTYVTSPHSYEDLYLHTLDAAIPPVVPTSKPPSGLSSRTSSKRNSLNFPLRSNSRASQSRTGQETGALHGMGTFSVEAGSRRSSLRAIAGERGHTVTLQPPDCTTLETSKEEVGEPDRALEQKPIMSWKRQSGKDQTSSQSGVQTTPQELSHIDLLPSRDEDFHVQLRLGLNTIPKRTSIQTLENGNTTAKPLNISPGSIESPRVIPMRQSSLRHSLGSSPPRRKRKSRHTGDEIAYRPQDAYVLVDGMDGNTTPKIAGNPAEDEVSKRIEELRALKQLRSQKLVDGTAESPNYGQTLGISIPPLRSSRRSRLEDSSPPESSHVPGPCEFSNISLKPELTGRAMPIRSMSSGPTCSLEYPDLISPASKEPRLKIRRSSTFQPRHVTSPLSPISPDVPKRVFSNTFSQVIRASQYDDNDSTVDSIDDAIDHYLSSPRLSQNIYHPQTKRIISFSEVGDPNGFTVFCCVGMGLTRYLMAFYDELASTLKLRLITPDRPGIGDSQSYPDGSDTPLRWPDDVLAICQHLKISRFSLLAHSAGAIYALATALRIPQYIRGRIHLLAPWIPPSQMSAIGTNQEPLPVNALPYSQRILRSLPTAFLKAANSSFLSATSASITTNSPKSPRRVKRKSFGQDVSRSAGLTSTSTSPRGRQSSLSPYPLAETEEHKFPDRYFIDNKDPDTPRNGTRIISPAAAEKERQTDYDMRLMNAIWDLATTNANPAVDLLVCLERRQSIGFRYVDINKAVVIHHGTRDMRVPLINAKWLGKTMRKCEVRVLEGENHSLMASAGVMANVLMEIAKEWEDWNRVVQGKRGEPKKGTAIS